MSLLTALNEAKGAIAAVALIGGGAIGMDARHPKYSDLDGVRAEVMSLKADTRVRDILHLRDQARREGAPEWLCKAIEEQFVLLCNESPDHYLCRDPAAKREIMSSAGC